MEKSVGNGYKNPVKVDTVHFTGLDKLEDSLSYQYSYNVKSEIVELGDMGMIKVPYTGIIAAIDNFSPDKREFPIEYWSYENTDEYETVIHIKAPAGSFLKFRRMNLFHSKTAGIPCALSGNNRVR